MSHSCPPLEDLQRLLDGEVEEPRRAELSAHLSACDRCAAALERSAERDLLLVGELGSAGRVRRFPFVSMAAAALLLVGLSLAFLRPEPSLSVEEMNAQAPVVGAGPEGSRVAALTGGVRIHSAVAERSHAAAHNETLAAGDRILTGVGERVKVALSGDAELILNENSVLRMGGGTDVTLEKGELLASSGRPLEIGTPEGTASLDSGEMRIHAAAEQTTVSVLRGQGRMKNLPQPISLDKGQEASLRGKALLRLRKLEKKVDTRWADEVQRVFLNEDFSAPSLSPLWRASESAGLVRDGDRVSLSLLAQPGEKKTLAFARFARDLPLEGPVVFEIRYRIPRGMKGGRAQIQLPTTGPDGPASLRWSLSSSEELLEAHGDAAGRKHGVLWKGRAPVADGESHLLRIVLSGSEVTVDRDGTRLVQAPHGLPKPTKVGLVLGSLVKPKSTDSFECRIEGVRILRDSVE